MCKLYCKFLYIFDASLALTGLATNPERGLHFWQDQCLFHRIICFPSVMDFNGSLERNSQLTTGTEEIVWRSKGKILQAAFGCNLAGYMLDGMGMHILEILCQWHIYNNSVIGSSLQCEIWKDVVDVLVTCAQVSEHVKWLLWLVDKPIHPHPRPGKGSFWEMTQNFIGWTARWIS